MGVYYEPKEPAIVPDGFLSLGVERRKNHRGRLSYVLWEEHDVVPQLVLEVVSQTYGQEYGDKQAKYARLGVLYYVVYNPDYSRRDKHEPFEVYRLVGEGYVRQPGEPVWMLELGLGIGRRQGTYEGWTREWLYWYDQEGNQYPTPEQIAQQEQRRADQVKQQLESLKAKLRERGLDPDNL